jgi:AraC-like DNA-binding protein
MIFNTQKSEWHTAGKVITVLIAAQMVVYLYFSINLLRIYQENIRQSYSYLEKINLNWLKFLLWGQIIIWPLFLLAEIINFQPRNYTWIILAVFIYMLGYFSIKQPEILVGIIPEFRPKLNSAKKYAKSALTREISEDYYNRLVKLMELKKPYLQNSLALSDVAQALSISNHNLSQVINEKTNLNFFEFINKYRIEEAKKFLLDKEKAYLTIAAISFEAGFNSVSSFNTVFKKMVKMTPSQFKTFHNSNK